MGRLASIVAKEILQGQKVTVVRCELIEISGTLMRSRMNFQRYLNKRMNSNPKRGHVHFRAPSMMFFKAVRGMVPRKLVRGQTALKRLTVFDGVPYPYDTKKKMVVPDALKAIKLNPDKPSIVLSELASRVGWNRKEIIEKLEQKRKEKAAVWYEKKVQKEQRRKEMEERLRDGPLAAVSSTLKDLGF